MNFTSQEQFQHTCKILWVQVATRTTTFYRCNEQLNSVNQSVIQKRGVKQNNFKVWSFNTVLVFHCSIQIVFARKLNSSSLNPHFFECSIFRCKIPYHVRHKILNTFRCKIIFPVKHRPNHFWSAKLLPLIMSLPPFLPPPPKNKLTKNKATKKPFGQIQVYVYMYITRDYYWNVTVFQNLIPKVVADLRGVW